MFFDSSTARNAAYFLYATGAGATTIVPIVAATGISITTGTNKITVTATGMPTAIFVNASQRVS